VIKRKVGLLAEEKDLSARGGKDSLEQERRGKVADIEKEQRTRGRGRGGGGRMKGKEKERLRNEEPRETEKEGGS